MPAAPTACLQTHSTGAAVAAAQEGQSTSTGHEQNAAVAPQAEGQSGVKRSREPEQSASAALHESKDQSADVAADDDAEGGARKRLRQDADGSSHTDQVSHEARLRAFAR